MPRKRLRALAYGVGFLAFGIVLLYTGFVDFYNSTQIALDGSSAEGRVVSVDKVQHTQYSDDYFLIIRFKDGSGINREFKNRHPHNFLFFPKVGETVSVRYLPNDPQIAMLATVWQSALGPLVSFLIGVLLCWLGYEELFPESVKRNKNV